MNKRKSKALIAGLVCCVLCVALNPLLVHANSANGNMDIVFVIDDSGSMRYSDPEQLSAEAVSQFMDILPEEGDQIGIVTYGLDAEESTSLRKIRGNSDKEEIKQFVKLSLKQDSMWTDTAAGLMKATEYLDEFKDPAHSQMIILITDGHNDFGTTGRTETDSNEVLKKVISKGYQINTIGLTLSAEEDKEYIHKIAQQTGGETYFPEKAEELSEVFLDIQAGALKGDVIKRKLTMGDNEPAQLKFNIPEGVFETNIQFSYSGEVVCNITNPLGTDVTSDASVSKGKSYTNIKLIEPESGEWIMTADGDVKENVEFNILYSYDINAVLSGSDAVTINDEQNYKIVLEDKNGVLSEADTYAGYKCSLVVTNAEGNQDHINALNCGDHYEANVKYPESGEFNLSAIINGKKLEIESNHLQVIAESTGKANAASGLNPLLGGKKVNNMVWGLFILIVVIMITLILRKRVKLVERKKSLQGQLKIILSSENGTMSTIWKRLNPFGRKANLFDVIGKVADFEELRGIQLSMNANSTGLLISNPGKLKLSARNAQNGNDQIELLNEKKLQVELNNKTAAITFYRG